MCLTSETERREVGPAKPVYDRMNLSLAVTAAAQRFHTRWRGLLGIEANPAARQRSTGHEFRRLRRLAEGWADEYDLLKPVADLRYELQRQVFLMLQQPLRWEGEEPDDAARQQIIDDISNAVTQRLFTLTRERLVQETRLGWQDAYAQRGPGSTFVRARIIARDVYRSAGLRRPGVVASPDKHRFLHSVAELIGEVAQESALTLE